MEDVRRGCWIDHGVSRDWAKAAGFSLLILQRVPKWMENHGFPRQTIRVAGDFKTSTIKISS